MKLSYYHLLKRLLIMLGFTEEFKDKLLKILNQYDCIGFGEMPYALRWVFSDSLVLRIAIQEVYVPFDTSPKSEDIFENKGTQDLTSR